MENNNFKQNNTDLKTDLKKVVLEKIREGEVRMRPKMYFFLKIAFLILIVAVLFITAVLLLSFIFFSIKVSGQLLLLGFGLRGFEAFFLLFPWNTLLIFLLMLIILERLLKRFAFGYRRPLIYLLAGLIALVLAFVVLISLTSFHNQLFRKAKNHALPVVGNYYIHARRIPKERGVLRGFVTDIAENSFVVQSDEQEENTPGGENPGTNATSGPQMKVSLPARIRVITPPTIQIKTLLKIGDYVFVAGTLEKDGVHAYGIKKMVRPADDE